jgi:hypothetical protein
MLDTDLPVLRLRHHGLLKPAFHSAEDVVEHLGAVQAQDFKGAKLCLALRMKRATDDSLNEAFNEGRILRTHVMRPTWHFVLPEDIRWMADLSASRLRSLQAPYDRKLELTAQFLRRCKRIFAEALKGKNFLTREELASRLAREGIRAKGQRLAHIMMHAEIDGLVCSGPLKGKQFTYALLDERAPNGRKTSRTEGMMLLATRYFGSHGPATIQDYAKWAGCTIKDAQAVIASMDSTLRKEKIHDADYYLIPSNSSAIVRSPQALLISVFDEYAIAYRNWDLLGARKEMKQKMFTMGNGVGNLLLIDGRIAGTWKRNVGGKKVLVSISPLHSLNAKERKAVHTAIRRFQEFLGREIEAKIR